MAPCVSLAARTGLKEEERETLPHPPLLPSPAVAVPGSPADPRLVHARCEQRRSAGERDVHGGGTEAGAGRTCCACGSVGQFLLLLLARARCRTAGLAWQSQRPSGLG